MFAIPGSAHISYYSTQNAVSNIFIITTSLTVQHQLLSSSHHPLTTNYTHSHFSHSIQQYGSFSAYMIFSYKTRCCHCPSYRSFFHSSLLIQSNPSANKIIIAMQHYNAFRSTSIFYFPIITVCSQFNYCDT